MRNKIIKTIMRKTALCMTILAISMQAGTITTGARGTKIDAVTECDSMTYGPQTQYLTWSEYSRQYAYGFKQSCNFGVAMPEAREDTIIYLEGLYGIRLSAEGNSVTYEPYKHNDAISDTANMTLYEIKDNKLVKVKSLGKADSDREYSLTYTFKNNIVYMIGASFKIQGIDERQEAIGFLYKTGGKLSVCRATSIDNNINIGIDTWNRLMKDVDPKDYLSNEKTTYPTSGTNGSVTHVKQWEDISDTLILHDDWTDEMKVFVFVDYLSKNIAYDVYRTRQPNNQSRASIAKDYTKDKYFTLGNNVGVCWDYVNILTIMCRHHGIPATSVENDTHTVNAVWLNGEWVCIDVTDTVRYNCETENTDKSCWIKHMPTYSMYGSYNGFGFTSIDDSIWTYEKGLGLK